VAGVGTINRSYGGIVGEIYNTANSIQRVISIPDAIHQPGGGGYYGLIAGYTNMSSSLLCPAVSGQKCMASNIISQICGTGNTPACDVNGTQLQTFPILKSTITPLFGTSAFDYANNTGAWMMSSTGTGYPRLRWEQVAEFTSPFAGMTLQEQGLGIDYSPITGRSVANLCKSTGKWYWEIDIQSGNYDFEFGIGASALTSSSGVNLAHNAGGQAWSIAHIAGSYSAFLGSGPDSTFGGGYSIRDSATNMSVYNSTGKTLGVAVDLDVSPRRLSFYLDGVLLVQQGNAGGIWTISTTGSLTTGALCPTYGRNSGTSTPYYNNVAIFNFGTKPFKYTAPANFKPYNFLE
jgi:hypothetical protein